MYAREPARLTECIARARKPLGAALCMGLCTAIAACVPASDGVASPRPATGSEQTDPMTSPPNPDLSSTGRAPPGSRPRSAAFDQALMARSNAALILFLIHHRDDPALASVREVLAHRSRPDSPAVLAGTARAEAAVIGAFDAARLAGTAAAWQDFLARYPGHVLASEVPFFMPD